MLTFLKQLKKIKDKALKERLKKQLEKIVENPFIGKPLSYALRGERTVRVGMFRIVYSFNNNTIIFLKIKHRKKVYR